SNVAVGSVERNRMVGAATFDALAGASSIVTRSGVVPPEPASMPLPGFASMPLPGFASMPLPGFASMPLHGPPASWPRQGPLDPPVPESRAPVLEARSQVQAEAQGQGRFSIEICSMQPAVTSSGTRYPSFMCFLTWDEGMLDQSKRPADADHDAVI